MSAFSFARQAFGREKPHSSITDWVDILTGSSIEEEAYDGIPELVDSINLQASGYAPLDDLDNDCRLTNYPNRPAEACRALRKKLKHGNPHQQYRALVLLKALVENCGQKFQNTFADGHMTDTLKHMCNDHTVDKRVRKKLLLVLASWRDQYQGDASMSVVAGLYKQCRGNEKGRIGQQEIAQMMGLTLTAEEKKRIEKEEAKLKVKQARQEEHTRQEAEARRSKRAPFNFEKEKPKVLATIVEASQASSNLVNAITLVNLKTDTLETNERVQDCLNKAKQARKPVVRYIQLVENEELIGTLIETNDRIMTALEMYDKLCIAIPPDETNDTVAVTSAMAATSISPVPKGKTKDTAETSPLHLHPDLEDLNFGSISHSSNLPAPIRPSTLSDDEERSPTQRPSLSDFSDYESDDETRRNNTASTSKRNFVTVSDNEDGPSAGKAAAQSRSLIDDDDPFADPFADIGATHSR
ncbi:hypothetical protein CVT24_009048 [Panaeolus cyanescens]|uniref:VHS domain-containing protein n=1 Tax=Panaeolus cyanescens TaxID=181874 RepID=A0A409YAL5_9AGAR|nr:hypothetical protein CVT24_009048 [Panaeolus cyanescens]